LEKNIAVIPGDGIGPEITPEAIKVLNARAEMAGYEFHYRHAEMGGIPFDKATAGMTPEQIKEIDEWSDKEKTKLSLPQEALDTMDWARDSRGAVLFGAVGRKDLPKRVAELGLLGMRKRYDVSNNRPFIIDPILARNSILYRDPVELPGIEFISPEGSLIGGVSTAGRHEALYSTTEKRFSRSDLEKTVKAAFEKAKAEGKKVMCVSKFNVLVSEKLLSDVFEEFAQKYGRDILNPNTIWAEDEETKEKYCTGQLIIDNAGMQIAAHPERYANTVVVVDRMFSEFLQSIVDVVRGSKAVSQSARDEIKEKGAYRTFIRELCGGLYFGHRHSEHDSAYDTMHYTRKRIEDLAVVARREGAKLGIPEIDSLEVERVHTFYFWRNVLDDNSRAHGYGLRHLNVREATETLMTDPLSLGTVISSNMMGDIYTDLAGAVVGKSLGLMPSSAVNADGFGIYEQIAGSAPDIAGKGKANPIAEIRSAAMMLEDWGDVEGARLINAAITKALEKVRTPDIWEPGYEKATTQQMGDAIVYHMKEIRGAA
jgi:isocitrate/isopropylmalate dehydrogenase